MRDVEPQMRALMVAALDGDTQAYAGLLARMGGYLRAYFRRRLGPGAPDIEDLVQDTLLAIHVKRGVYDPKQPFTPWAYALARYRLLEHLRRSGRRAVVPLEDAGALFAEENPEEGATRRDLGKLLSRLSPRQRKLVMDVKLTGLSVGEAAASSGLTAGAVKVGLHRAVQALKRAARDEDR